MDLQAGAPMILLISASYDATSDLYVEHLGNRGVFRFNCDLFSSYSLELSPGGFRIEDPLGRAVGSAQITACYWRKPFHPLSLIATDPEQQFEEHQRRSVTEELQNLLIHQGTWSLIEHSALRRCGKLTQMIVASRFFCVPDWRVFHRPHTRLEGSCVVKALIQHPVHEDQFMVTSTCDDLSALADDYTWFVQKAIDAAYDLTAVYCCGRVFSWILDRSDFTGVDWRTEAAARRVGAWRSYDLGAAWSAKIQALMRTLGLQFGRLDFLLDRHDKLYFLEVNPNGQFAWLDPDDRTGMLSWVFDCATRCPV